MSLAVRYLVVGSGSIARRHIANLKKISPQCDVICVSSSGRCIDKQSTGATYVCSSIASAIALKPYFAVVASPATCHLDNAVELLKKGIPVLIEKPLCSSLSNFNSSAEFLIRNQSRIEIGYSLRYLSSARRIKEVLAQKVIGEIYSIAIDVGQYLPSWRPGSDYKLSVSAREELGGGVLLELSHEFDYLTWLFGKFDVVYCVSSNSGQLEINVEDRADITFSRADGVVAHLHMDFLQQGPTRCCKVVGKHGNLFWDLISNTISLQTSTCTELLFNDPLFNYNDMYIEQFNQFIQVVEGHNQPNVGLESALYTLKLIEAVKASSVSKMPIFIKGL